MSPSRVLLRSLCEQPTELRKGHLHLSPSRVLLRSLCEQPVELRKGHLHLSPSRVLLRSLSLFDLTCRRPRIGLRFHCPERMRQPIVSGSLTLLSMSSDGLHGETRLSTQAPETQTHSLSHLINSCNPLNELRSVSGRFTRYTTCVGRHQSTIWKYVSHISKTKVLITRCTNPRIIQILCYVSMR